ncbi:exo-beta-N-acetylmuramidase NamZ domain-containing protein [Leptospira sp. WS92.C1]
MLYTKIKKKFFLLVIFFLFLPSAACAEKTFRKHISHSQLIPSETEFYSTILPGLSGKNVILITNPSGIGRSPERIIREFKKNDVKIKHLIGLEHGFLGLEEDFSKSPVTVDEFFNLPIYHIYRVKNAELPAILKGADAILFDVQDMGMRCYTYLTVLKRIMDGIPDPASTRLIVLDHINPALYLKGRGEMIDKKYLNFAGEFPSLFLTGLTLGESALFYNSEYLSKKIKLEIVSPKNAKRSFDWEQEGIPWTTPSPNLPMVDSAINYLGLVLLEGVNVSVGRGTTAPFVYFGAPWMNEPEKLAEELNQNSNGDYYYQSVFFKPVFGPYKNEICRGLRLTVVNRKYDPLKMAYKLIATIKTNYKDFKWRAYPDGTHNLDFLWGTESLRKSIDSGKTYDQYSEFLSSTEKEYNENIKKYYLY